MLKTSNFESTTHEDQNTENAPITTKIGTFLEQWTIYFYSICSYDMEQWSITFVIQWCILALQIMRFLSDAYVPFEWNNPIARVAVPISHFVTEIPLVSVMTAYFMSVGMVAAIIVLIVFSTLTHLHFQWMLPVRIMRQVLFWCNVLFFPMLVPHCKMVFACLSYPAASYSIQPYYPDLVCWKDTYNGYFVLSLFIMVAIIAVNWLNTMCFYNAAIPNETQVHRLHMNAKYSGITETALVTGKIIILAFATGGHTSGWRLPVGALTFLFGCASTYHIVSAMVWWHDTTMALFIFKALILTWTGCIAMLTVPLGDTYELGLVYYLMLPVLFITAHLMLRWRCLNILSLAAHDLDSPLLAILKIRCIMRSFILWLSIFDGQYVEMNAQVQERIDKRNFLISHIIELATNRFPNSADLHILCSMYSMTVKSDQELAYRSLRLAEQAGEDLDNRFRCDVIRRALDAAADEEMSEELRKYTEFKAKKELGEHALSQSMVSLVRFWTEVLEENPNIDSLIEIAEKTRSQLDVTIQHFERMLELNKRSVPVLRLYGVLCLEVLGDIDRAHELLCAADAIKKEINAVLQNWSYSGFLRTLDLELDIFDDHNGVISIFVNPENVGIVSAVNPALLKMLDIPHSKDIVGKNVNMIIPEPIRSHHDRFLLDYSATHRSALVNNTVMAMAVHRNGHLLPCAVYLRWANKTVGKMIATMQPLTNPHEVALIVDSATLNITYATLNFAPFFGFSKRDILAQKISLFDVLPQLKDEDSANQINEVIYRNLISERGYSSRSEHSVTQQPFNMHCYLRFVSIYETSLIFFHCEVSQVEMGEANGYSEDISSPTQLARNLSMSARSQRRTTPSSSSARRRDPAKNSTTVPSGGDSTNPTLSSIASRTGLTERLRLKIDDVDEDVSPRNGTNASLENMRLKLHISPLSVQSDSQQSAGHTQGLTGEQSELKSESDSDDILLPMSTLVDQGVARGLPSNDADQSNPSTTDHLPSALNPVITFSQSSRKRMDISARNVAATPLADLRPEEHHTLPPKTDISNSPYKMSFSPVSQRRRSSFEIDIASQEKLTSSHRRRHRTTQRRLKAAINISNMYAEQRLRWFTIYASIIIVAAITLIAINFALTSTAIDRALILTRNITTASQRQVVCVGIAALLHVYHLFNWSPLPNELAQVVNSSGVPAHMLKLGFFYSTLDLAKIFSEYSFRIDNVPTDHKKLIALLNEDIVPLYMPDPHEEGHAHEDKMSLKNAALHVSALTNWSLEESKVNMNDDYGHFFIVANTVSGKIIDPLMKSIKYNVEEINQKSDEMLIVCIIFFVVTVTTCIISGAIFIVPLLLYVEKSKTRVLELFLAVPPSIRRSLRHKALSVYRLVDKVEENDRAVVNRKIVQVQREADVDEEATDDEIPRGQQNAAEPTVPTVDAYDTIFRKYANLGTLEQTSSLVSTLESATRIRDIGSLSHRRGSNGFTEEPVSVRTPASPENPSQIISTPLSTQDVNLPEVGESATGAQKVGISYASSHINSQEEDKNISVHSSMPSAVSHSHAPRKSDNADGNDDKQPKYNLWMQSSLTAGGSRFSVFILILTSYFVLLLIYTSQMNDALHDAVQRVYLGGLRNPQITLSMFYVLEHLFNNKTEAVLENPMDPMSFTRSDYATAALKEIEFVREVMSGLVVGGYGEIHRKNTDPEQDQLMFHSLCDVDPIRFLELYPDSVSNPQLFPFCPFVGGGILTHGLYPTFMFLYDQIHILAQPEYNKILHYIFTGETPQGNPVLIATAKQTFSRMFDLYYNFVLPFLRFSGYVYTDKTVKLLQDFEETRYVLIGACAAVLFISMLLLLRPFAVQLGRTVRQTHATMLLMPRQCCRLREIQVFIDDTLSKY